VSCCPLPKNSPSAASRVLVVKASFWAWEEANSRFVVLPEKWRLVSSARFLAILVPLPVASAPVHRAST
jgi:hypothetical protein